MYEKHIQICDQVNENLQSAKCQKSDSLNTGEMIHENKFSEVVLEVLIIRGLISKRTASGKLFVGNSYGKDPYCQKGGKI